MAANMHKRQGAYNRAINLLTKLKQHEVAGRYCELAAQNVREKAASEDANAEVDARHLEYAVKSYANAFTTANSYRSLALLSEILLEHGNVAAALASSWPRFYSMAREAAFYQHTRSRRKEVGCCAFVAVTCCIDTFGILPSFQLVVAS